MRVFAQILLSVWILWVNSGSGDDATINLGRWFVYDGYDSRLECHKARTTLMQKTLKEFGGAWKMKDYTLSSRNGTQSLKYYYHCLPAELDPRP